MGRYLEFIDNNDGTITDTRTNLMWEKAHSKELVNFEEAATYCYRLELAGHKDWRLPEVWELVSIVDYSQCNPAIYYIFKGAFSSYYWTNTYSLVELGGAWVIDFDNGSVDYGNIKSKLHVRAVREIK